MASIKKAVEWWTKTAKDDTHGYDQTHRQGVDYDCSSYTANGLAAGGFNVAKSSTTRNLYSRLKAAGWYVYNGADRQAGDIFLTPGRHVVPCVDASKIGQCAINEKGTATGGQPGDQTGKEIYIADFYNPGYGWTYHLRYGGENDALTKAPTPNTVKQPAYVIGATYTTKTRLKVRSLPSVTSRQISFLQLTADAKKHADKSGVINAGTRVTCKGISSDQDGRVWIKTPSGYMCAVEDGKVYIC